MLSKKTLEKKQVFIYLITILISFLLGLYWEESQHLERLIEPVIAVLLYSMFCQIPFLEIREAFKNKNFFAALLVGNFILIPLLVTLLVLVFQPAPLVSLGIVLVLLTPCVDYVIVFSHLGKADSKSLLAATPLLFIFQLVLLPFYLWALVGKDLSIRMEVAPFIQSFLYLMILPFLLSIATQFAAKSNIKMGKVGMGLSAWLPVPFMSLTLLTIIASQIPLLHAYGETIGRIIPLYIVYAILAPFIGKLSARLFKVDVAASRSVSFSVATRNSLVVLPLALALPAPENNLLAVVIVTQTMVELLFELIYIKAIPSLIKVNANENDGEVDS